MMTEDIYFYFFVWLGIAVVLVIATAALLMTIIWCAHNIVMLADDVLDVVEDIELNTKSIWQLNATYAVAANLLTGAKAIDSNSGKIVEALTKLGKKETA